MNRKILFTVVLSTVLLAALLVGIVASNRNTNTEYVPYKFEAVLSDPIVTITDNPPMRIIEGYRPASGVQSANVTINGVVYTYPNDFSYNETFRVEANTVTGKVVFIVTSVMTFNMPGNPTITEYMTAQGTRNATTTAVTIDDGIVILTGSGAFEHVSGNGFVVSTQQGNVDYARHIGLIKGWPL